MRRTLKREAIKPPKDWTGSVTHSDQICDKSRNVNLSLLFAGQGVGVKQVDARSDEARWPY